MDERVRLRQMPVGVRLVPHAIEPDATDGPVICEQLPQLSIHIVVQVRVPISMIGTTVVPLGGRLASPVVFRVTPVQFGILKNKLVPRTMRSIPTHFPRL